MAKKRVTAPPAPKSVSLDRASRLYKLIKLLDMGPKSRAVLLRKLKIDIRTFYRDLELLRECRIAVTLERRMYELAQDAGKALAALPFPDPGLTLGEAKLLARGRTAIHAKLRRLLAAISR